MCNKKYYLFSLILMMMLFTPSVILAEEMSETPIQEDLITECDDIEEVPFEESISDDQIQDQLVTSIEELSEQSFDEQVEIVETTSSSSYTGIPLEGVNATLYELLSNSVTQVAEGEIDYTVFSFTDADLNLEDVSYSKTDLGVDSFISESGSLSEETKTAFNEKIGFSLNVLNKALLYNHPYELYWYDKAYDGALRYSGSFSVRNGLHMNSMKLYMMVSADYSKTQEAGTYDFNIDAAVSVQAAKETAQSIVAQYADYDDYEKLMAYKDTICDMASYNHEAIDTGADYGNPWQLVWVFDNDPSTSVVCEGYAKAFDYLCSLSTFKNTNLVSYLVSGLMNTEQHMWNMVSFGTNNYLVDITNCDTGTVGSPSKLFLAGYTSGNLTDGYRIQIGTRIVKYILDDSSKLIYSEPQLQLSNANFFDAVNDVKHSVSDDNSIDFYFSFTEPLLEQNASIAVITDDHTVSIPIDNAGIEFIENVNYHHFTSKVTSFKNLSKITVQVLLENGECLYAQTYSKDEFANKQDPAYYYVFPFNDVTEDAWYYDTVKECYEIGLINGTSESTFSPMQEMTRAMVVTILWRMEGSPTVVSDGSFKDVSSKQWYASSISWAKLTGVVHGYGDGTFKPDQPVTREQLAAILANYANYKGVYTSGMKKLNTYPDGSQVSAWAQGGMKWAVSNGIVSGNGEGYLRPKKTASRAEGATMLLRMKKWLERIS